jgi:hypothetical protein
MPKKKVSDHITDQEMAFARLVLSGTMTDHAAAQAAGLNPETAAYTKAKPPVRAYMLAYRAAIREPLLDQEADLSRRAVETPSRKEQRREQVLDRLWELAKLGPETTRNSITGQVKAIAMIVAIEGLIPDRRAGSAENKSAPPLPQADIYASAWRRNQQEKTIDPQPDPVPAPEQEDRGPAEHKPAPAAVADVPLPPARPLGPAYDRSESMFASLFHPSAPAFVSAPDTRLPFSIKRNPFARRPR